MKVPIDYTTDPDKDAGENEGEKHYPKSKRGRWYLYPLIFGNGDVSYATLWLPAKLTFGV